MDSAISASEVVDPLPLLLSLLSFIVERKDTLQNREHVCDLSLCCHRLVCFFFLVSFFSV